MPQQLTRRVSKRTGSAIWQVRIQVGKKPDGKPHFLIKSFAARKDAVAFLNKARRDRDQGVLVDPSKLTLSEFLDRWFEAKRGSLKPNTFESYRRHASTYIEPSLGHRRLDRLSALEVQQVWSSLLALGLSTRTVLYAHAILRHALQQAVRWRMLARNVADDVDLPRHVRHEMKALGEAEVRRFFEVLLGTKHEVLFKFLIVTGVRPSEAFAVTWSDLDLEHGSVTIQRSLSWTKSGWSLGTTKTSRSRRQLPLSANMVELLRRHRARQFEHRMRLAGRWRDNGFVFADECGGPLRAANVLRRHLRPLLRKAGLDDGLRLYDLRHTCASLLLAKNVHPKVAAERLGHSSVTLTLDTYSHVAASMQQHASELLDSILDDGSAT